MATTKVFDRTTTRCAYGMIFPNYYDAAKKWPVWIWLHGIGESGKYKTVQQLVDFHWFLKYAADIFGIVFILPQDYDADVFADGEVDDVFPEADKISNGQIALGGLSLGGGGTLSYLMSNFPNKSKIVFYLALVPGNWEGMNEVLAAQSDVPFWIVAGAKDTAVTIDRVVNTVDDILRAGRKENFYFSIIVNEDHYLWNEVMGATDAPAINPTNSAAKWEGTNTVNGVEVDVEVQCVNDPAVNMFQFFLMQKPGAFAPLPRLGTEPTPAPTPPPITTPVSYKYFREFISTSDGVYKITWDNSTFEYYKLAAGELVTQQYCKKNTAGRYYFVLQTSKTRKVYDKRVK